jgi:hypothetical protein
LQNEGESEENPGAPPRCLGENRSGLTDPDESVRGRAGATEVCGETAALACLQQNRRNKDQRIYDENYEKEIVEHRSRKRVGSNFGALLTRCKSNQREQRRDYRTTELQNYRTAELGNDGTTEPKGNDDLTD